MQQASSVEITARALQLLSAISTPVSVEDFIRLELTGDPTADIFLSKISRMMLEQLRSDGMIISDDLTAPSPQIYGLTPQGIKMHQFFLTLTNA
ncbi:hypothetical protein HFU84_12930 [Acidithiobacillus sp. CV18-2]|uniref:Uncharacterized protein n=1 Tax=Igneacidithiobacillus copahuensis TaxID=2724909 RepID=A0AAE2YPJ7_9PROT|nr:hypothetical protein [Igneacidithiobacillus copahuensis]MBU2754511.1 hypothetical protein [Acidithiobacillus sp. CV18-3]MBU2756816.1 hypothetical protein [Acidithiobacillus sp. BN09-2]MBU2778383.1 hypothetical protein [Acidithiobacillus sp. CV18-2]MBU2797654.1 hypothetical protein [Acidithiobacillus sp. VAN18-2]MBU2797983.1 hypothetical protein [Acidithiobacillus sp. VAN18-4]UTV80833.1 hypothetical protein MQE22_12595 [Acidithiobacillus sp. YTS05]